MNVGPPLSLLTGAGGSIFFMMADISLATPDISFTLAELILSSVKALRDINNRLRAFLAIRNFALLITGKLGWSS